MHGIVSHVAVKKFLCTHLCNILLQFTVVTLFNKKSTFFKILIYNTTRFGLTASTGLPSIQQEVYEAHYISRRI